ncbi:Imm51 family immunity protein [Prevotella sp.]|uniref:Imm51 family immunity protein n=1 Tax=Prevotella sp. TaxID=59823 RepID=UPI003AB93CCB
MGNIFKAIKKRLSKRQRPSDGNGGLDVVEDSPYYPFSFLTNDRGEYVVALYADVECKQDVFEDQELPGNGYDWEKIAKEYISRELPEADEQIGFDSEADMFYAYSEDENVLKQFIMGLKETCEDDDKLASLVENIDKEKICYD